LSKILEVKSTKQAKNCKINKKSENYPKTLMFNYIAVPVSIRYRIDKVF
jgi:hypothetical protein